MAFAHGAVIIPWGGKNPHGAVSQNGFILPFHNFFKPPHGPFTAPWINYRPMGSSNLLAATLGRAANRVQAAYSDSEMP